MLLRLDAEQQRLLARGRQLLALAEIGREGDDLAAIGGLQPLQDDRGVEPARIGEHDLLDVAFRHDGGSVGQNRADYRGNAGAAQHAPTAKKKRPRGSRGRSNRQSVRRLEAAAASASRRPARAGAPRRRDSRPTPARRGSNSSAGRRSDVNRRRRVVARLRRRGRADDGASRQTADDTGRHRAAVAPAWAGAGRTAAPMVAAATRTIKPLVMIEIPQVVAADSTAARCANRSTMMITKR